MQGFVADTAVSNAADAWLLAKALSQHVFHIKLDFCSSLGWFLQNDPFSPSQRSNDPRMEQQERELWQAPHQHYYNEWSHSRSSIGGIGISGLSWPPSRSIYSLYPGSTLLDLAPPLGRCGGGSSSSSGVGGGGGGVTTCATNETPLTLAAIHQRLIRNTPLLPPAVRRSRTSSRASKGMTGKRGRRSSQSPVRAVSFSFNHCWNLPSSTSHAEMEMRTQPCLLLAEAGPKWRSALDKRMPSNLARELVSHCYGALLEMHTPTEFWD